MLRRSFSKLFAVACCSLAVSTPAIPADYGVSLTARAEAAVDPATRHFIETLPGVWQPQIQKIVDGVLTRTDASIARAVSEVQGAISLAISDAQCAAIATEKSVVDDIVGRFPWVKEKEPIPDLRRKIAQEAAGRKYTNSPTEIKDKYTQIQLLTSVVKCQFNRIPTAQHDLNEIMDAYNIKWLVWNRLESIKCTSGESCINDYHTLVEKLVQTTDRDELKDVKESHADVDFTRFTVPGGPSIFAYFKNYDYDTFESALADLYNIENSIYLARAKRLVRADDKLVAARAEYDAGDLTLKNMCYVMSGSPGQPTDGDYKNAGKRAPVVTIQMTKASALVADALQIDGGHKAQAGALQAQIDRDATRAATLADIAAHEYLGVGPHDCR